LEDASAVAGLVMDAVPAEFAYLQDEAIIDGNGASQPLGILNSNALVSVAAEGGQAAQSIIIENVVNMYARFFMSSLPGAVWVINQDILPQLFLMTITVGTGGAPVYLPAGNVAGAPFGTLLGKPILPMEQAKTLGTVGDFMLIDPSQYIMIDKGGVNQENSIHVQFTTDESAFRWLQRTEGQPEWNSAITPANGTNTVSPFVALATRA
jgi:HK97 family phage major capsid protein